jgi:hypothetical protein
LLNCIEQLDTLPRKPKVIITTPSNLRLGYSKQIFIAWAHDPRNAVIFLNNPTEPTSGSDKYFSSYRNSLKPYTSIEIQSNIPIDENDFSNYSKYMESRDKIQPKNIMKLFKQKLGLIINKTLVSALKAINFNYNNYFIVRNKKRVTWRDRVQIDGFMADYSLPFPTFTFREDETRAWDNFGKLIPPHKNQRFCRSKVSYFDHDLKSSGNNLRTKNRDLLFSAVKPEYSIKKKDNIIQLHCKLQMHLIIIDQIAYVSEVKNLITKFILPCKILIVRGGRRKKNEFQKIFKSELKYGPNIKIHLFEKEQKVELTYESFPYKIKLGHEMFEFFQHINQSKIEIGLLRGSIIFSDDCKIIRLRSKSLRSEIIPSKNSRPRTSK